MQITKDVVTVSIAVLALSVSSALAGFTAEIKTAAVNTAKALAAKYGSGQQKLDAGKFSILFNSLSAEGWKGMDDYIEVTLKSAYGKNAASWSNFKFKVFLEKREDSDAFRVREVEKTGEVGEVGYGYGTIYGLVTDACYIIAKAVVDEELKKQAKIATKASQ